MTNRPVLAAVVLALGLSIAGIATGVGFARGRAADRYVTVKGVAEREVQADLAIWPLRVVVANNDLGEANRAIQASVRQVREFLARQGIDSNQTSLQDFAVTDAYANQYGSRDQVTSRYVIRQTLVVRSTQPDQVAAASQRVPELVSSGVVLSTGSEYGGSAGPTFLFTKLNDVKPAMIQEATARAREAAEQFARDSNRWRDTRQFPRIQFPLIPELPMSRLVVTMLLLALPAVAAAQSPANPAVAAAAAPYNQVKGYLLKSAEQTPESLYAFKATPEVRSLGQLIAHVADGQISYCSAALGEKSSQPSAEKTMTTKTELVEALKKSIELCDRAYAQTDAQAMAPATIFGSPSTRLGALVMNSTHDFEHYGNIVTYLRLKGIVPPSSQRGG